jgi:hypothetical protein
VASSLLSSVRFGSFLVYSPRGTGEVSRRSQRFTYAVKTGRPEALPQAVDRLARDFDSTPLPAPRSSLLVTGGLWPARLIAEALTSHDLGAAVLPILTRVEPVPKSAFQARGERPNARRHFETMAIEPALASPRITLVDDVITKGNTLLAAASRVAIAFPHAEINAFALIRTMGRVSDIERIVDPCVGTVRMVFDEALREP